MKTLLVIGLFLATGSAFAVGMTGVQDKIQNAKVTCYVSDTKIYGPYSCYDAVLSAEGTTSVVYVYKTKEDKNSGKHEAIISNASCLIERL